jgi:hypothetical protein
MFTAIKQNVLPLQFSTLLSFLITISTVGLHLIFLNINKINTCPYSVLLYKYFFMYALSYTIFIKISYCCYHEICPPIYSQIEIYSYNFLVVVGYIFWGLSLIIYTTS